MLHSRVIRETRYVRFVDLTKVLEPEEELILAMKLARARFWRFSVSYFALVLSIGF